jgi:hypothetical protein
MSERALAFVEEWIADHITAKDAQGDIEARAKALADRCLGDAGKAGITATEIGDAIDDLPDFILGAIEEAEDREEHADEDEDIKEASELVDADGIKNAEEDAIEDEEGDENEEEK